MAFVMLDPEHTHLFSKDQLPILEESLKQICSEYLDKRMVIRITWTHRGYIETTYREGVSKKLLSVFSKKIEKAIVKFLENVGAIKIPKTSKQLLH